MVVTDFLLSPRDRQMGKAKHKATRDAPTTDLVAYGGLANGVVQNTIAVIALIVLITQPQVIALYPSDQFSVTEMGAIFDGLEDFWESLGSQVEWINDVETARGAQGGFESIRP